MNRPSLPYVALFTPTGFLGLAALFGGAAALLLSGGASPEAAGLFALVFVMGTGEAFLTALDKGVRTWLNAPARRVAIAHAQTHAHTDPSAAAQPTDSTDKP